MRQRFPWKRRRQAKNRRPETLLSILNPGIIPIWLPLVALASFVSSLSAEEVLAYESALDIAYRQAPPVHQSAKELAVARSREQQASFLLPEGPSLEASITRGTFNESIEILDSNTYTRNGRDLPLRGWEVGLAQSINIAGEQGLTLQQREAERQTAELELQVRRLSARARARELYLQAALLQSWSEHIRSHLNRLYRLRARFGRGYIDRRLGSYSLVALNMGIQSLESERERANRESKDSFQQLQLLLGREEELRLQPVSSIPLPELAPLDFLQSKMEEHGPVLQRQRYAFLAVQRQSELSQRRLWPSPTISLFAGQRLVNGEPSISVSPANRENYFRAGLRLPLGILGPERLQGHIDELNADRARIKLETDSKGARMQLRAAHDAYSSIRLPYLRTARFLDQAERFFPALDQALMGRRITFFEYWGEHERFHSLFEQNVQARLAAAKALGQLEILTGIAMEGDFPMETEKEKETETEGAAE